MKTIASVLFILIAILFVTKPKIIGNNLLTYSLIAINIVVCILLILNEKKNKK